MLSALTRSETTLMLKEYLIKVTVHLIKHTRFANFEENGKDTEFRYQICSSFYEWVS